MSDNVTDRIERHKAKVYQTDRYTAAQIAKLQERAEGQEKKIARFFYNHRGEEFGPCQVHKEFFPHAPHRQKWDLNSTRRAISNLTEEDILIHVDGRRPTYRGGTEGFWRWKEAKDFEKEPEQSELFDNSGPRQYSGAGA